MNFVDLTVSMIRFKPIYYNAFYLLVADQTQYYFYHDGISINIPLNAFHFVKIRMSMAFDD